MNRGKKPTDEMKKRWHEQWVYIACTVNVYERLTSWEEEFIISIENKLNNLTIHQSFKLNQICNKYQ